MIDSPDYRALVSYLREVSLLGSVGSVLGWDFETQMPPNAAEHRGDQQSLLARMVHNQFTSKQVGQWLGAIESSGILTDPESDQAVNVRELRRSYDRAVKVPASLVEEMTKTCVLGHQAWIEARKKSEFKLFAPWLEKILDLKRQEVACVGGTNVYDTLLDEYEPGETSANLKKTFETLRDPLVDLVGRIASSGKKAPTEILERKYPAEAQQKLARLGAEAVGFDFKSGRLDTSVHPFCTELGPRDVRMTTRYDENYFGDAFFGVLHETGHGLYAQGLPSEHWGLPRGEPISLGIHESQSRMWENLVGRSRSFWNHFFPKAKESFGSTLADVSLDQWHFAINNVQPSLIRVEADEATYNLHILLRFEIEIALMEKSLSVNDLPGAWNEKMQKYLGLTPPNDAQGCLQDTHWSGGGVGYFPTYTLGNLYSAQFFEQARKDLGDLDAQSSKGEFSPLLGWLRKNIHSHGKKYRAPALVQRVTGKPLSSEPLLRHLRKKASELFGV